MIHKFWKMICILQMAGRYVKPCKFSNNQINSQESLILKNPRKSFLGAIKAKTGIQFF